MEEDQFRVDRPMQIFDMALKSFCSGIVLRPQALPFRQRNTECLEYPLGFWVRTGKSMTGNRTYGLLADCWMRRDREKVQFLIRAAEERQLYIKKLKYAVCRVSTMTRLELVNGCEQSAVRMVFKLDTGIESASLLIMDARASRIGRTMVLISDKDPLSQPTSCSSFSTKSEQTGSFVQHHPGTPVRTAIAQSEKWDFIAGQVARGVAGWL